MARKRRTGRSPAKTSKASSSKKKKRGTASRRVHASTKSASVASGVRRRNAQLVMAGRGLAQASEEVVEQAVERDASSRTSQGSGDLEPQNKLEAGPRKQRTSGTPQPRLENHKVRSVWFQARTAWPVREAPIRNLVRERERARKTTPPTPGTQQWEPIGPTNIGGRLTSLVCHPVHPEKLWAGAAGGGVWFSPDAGQSWQAQWHDQDVLNVGALALDSSSPDTIYCGTGEANLSADSYPGVGLYRTRDGGASWQLLASAETRAVPRRIGAIAIDPFDSNHLCIGGVGFLEVANGGDLGGFFVSRDAGVTWQRDTFLGNGNYWCHAVVFHPTVRGTLFITVTERGSRSGIYRSTDGGATWVQLTKGLPDPARFGRTSLALCPSKPDTLYAFAADEQSAHADMLLGVYRSRDGGASWTEISGAHFRQEGQISYGNTIVVHPTNANHVLCGGVDLHRTTDGGTTWTKVTKWNADRGTPHYAHADHHCLVMPAAAPGRVYDPNDGGLDVSENGGDTWVNRSNGLAVTMFYDMDVAQSDGRARGGGAQDNGTVVTASGRSDDFFELLGGDGGWIVYDPKAATRVFASYYNIHLFRFDQGAYADVSPPCSDAERNAVWMAFVLLDPSDAKTVLCGSSRLWRSSNSGGSWKPVSPAFDGSTISCIEVALTDSKRIYIGTENGGVFRTTDGAKTWSPNLSGGLLPGHAITRLASSPVNPDRVYVTVANFGHSHVFASSDGCRTWQDIDKGQLPDVPHHAIAIPRIAPDTIYVCNDVGVYASADAGKTWSDMSRNLPHVMIVDLAYHETDKTLSAASYGRSMWRIHTTAL